MSILGKLAVAMMYLCRAFPIDQKKIVFSSFFGTKYADSPRVISEMLSSNKQIKRVWILAEGEDHPSDVRVVRPKSFESIYELATAKIWIDNSRKTLFVRKRKNQFYIQTWHGGVALKQVERAAENTLKKTYLEAAKKDSKMIDAFISECDWNTQQIRRDFWYDGEIIRSGLPRTDKLFENPKSISEKVRDVLSIEPTKKIVLYAPTFRKSQTLDVYSLDYDMVRAALKEKFGGEWCVIVRLHPNISDKASQIRYNTNIINGSVYGDINDILIASDVLITDYSSCMFDAFLIKKKVFLFAADVEEYASNDRSLTFRFDELPASLALNNDALYQNIIDFQEDVYEVDRNRFIDRLGYYADGHATERITQRIIAEMGIEENKAV